MTVNVYKNDGEVIVVSNVNDAFILAANDETICKVIWMDAVTMEPVCFVRQSTLYMTNGLKHLVRAWVHQIETHNIIDPNQGVFNV